MYLRESLYILILFFFVIRLEDVFIKKINEYYENRKNIELSNESDSEE